MATIETRKRPGGTYYRVRVRIKGYPPQQKTFKRVTDARRWAQQTEAAIRQGEFRNVVSAASSKTLGDVIARYRREELPHKAESTQRAVVTYLAFWERALGDYALSYLTPEHISGALGDLAAAGDTRRKLDGKTGDNGDSGKPAKPKPKSRKTVKLYRDNLAALLKHARAWGWLADNPMDGVSAITKIRNERTRFLSDDERDRLLEACKASTNDALYTVVVFALSTGARKNEILSLTLPDIDLKRGRAVLRDTKNGDIRSVPLAKHLVALLEDQVERVEAEYAKYDKPPKTLWLFPGKDGTKPVDIRTAWENARDKAGLDDFRFHDLRHSTASYLAMKGASLVEIADVLGHRTLQMVRRYAHLSESHVKGLIDGLSEDMFRQSP
jgi:integrase